MLPVAEGEDDGDEVVQESQQQGQLRRAARAHHGAEEAQAQRAAVGHLGHQAQHQATEDDGGEEQVGQQEVDDEAARHAEVVEELEDGDQRQSVEPQTQQRQHGRQHPDRPKVARGHVGFEPMSIPILRDVDGVKEQIGCAQCVIVR